ncbi:MAG: hypothetical protein U5L06_00725 [Rhodovibrio sp.]|nr:hypothetical protein [Rhodovibrio sp.]
MTESKPSVKLVSEQMTDDQLAAASGVEMHPGGWHKGDDLGDRMAENAGLPA